MILDFKDIPQANRANGQQDTFEQFARDFLLELGFKLEYPPGRGPDDGKDLVVSEIRTGVSKKETKFYWLVSCKHKAHSGSSVNADEEVDPKGRVDHHKCDGFLAFYSVVPSSPLTRKLHSLTEYKIEVDIFDDKRIEKELLISTPQRQQLIIQYFTNSFTKNKELLHQSSVPGKQKDKRESDSINSENQKSNEREQSYCSQLSENDILRITKTAVVLIEIEKIKEEYYEANNYWNETALNKLYKFTDHANEKIASAIFDFIQSVSDRTRARMPSDIAGSIHSLVLTFFPSSYENEENERIENGKKCIYIGFSLAYDALVYLNNFRIAEYGLSIWKFIYRQGKRNGMTELVEAVLQQYNELEQTLDRLERDDLGYAKEIVKVFKDDLDTWDLAFPVLPEHLIKLTLADEKK